MIRLCLLLVVLAGIETTAAPSSRSAKVSWQAASWGRPVSYLVGWGQNSGSYPNTASTTSTSYIVTGLKNNQGYYFSVRTVDSQGFQSPWAPPKYYVARPNATASTDGQL